MSCIDICKSLTQKKILLKTTIGDIVISLFINETPVASCNFLKLVSTGYFNNTIFHRIVKDLL